MGTFGFFLEGSNWGPKISGFCLTPGIKFKNRLDAPESIYMTHEEFLAKKRDNSVQTIGGGGWGWGVRSLEAFCSFFFIFVPNSVVNSRRQRPLAATAAGCFLLPRSHASALRYYRESDTG